MPSAALTARLPVFDIPHKGVRNALSQLSLLAGQTDYTDPAAVERLYQLGRQVFRLLTLHATDENEVTFHELDQRSTEASQHRREEHEELEELQHRLEQLLESIHRRAGLGEDLTGEGARFYQLFTELHAHHLEHMLEEERDTQPLLWKYFSDEELMGHRRTIIGRNRPEDLLLFFRFIIPGQNPQERAGLLRGVKAGAPAPFFQSILEMLKEVLPAQAYSRLVADLG